MADVQLVETSLRDGNQCLWAALGVDTARTLTIAPVMDRVGFKAIDFTTSTHMGVAVRYKKEDPWERIRLMAAATPNTPLQFMSTGFRFISWETAHAEFMALVFRVLARNGIRRFCLADPMNDADSNVACARMVKQGGGEYVIAALVFTLSPVHDDAHYAEAARKLAASPDVDALYIKDPGGLLSPNRARTLIPAIKAVIGAKPLELHAHCTIGLAEHAYMDAPGYGVSALQCASGGAADGTSNPPALRVVSNLRALGHTVRVDDAALTEVDTYFTQLAEAEGLPTGRPQAFDASYLQHQLPGGMVGTMRRQLAESRLSHLEGAVIEELGRVREELGWPIVMTPFAQIVMTQAVMNVTTRERYEVIPDEAIRYAIGRFGRPNVPIDAKVMERIESLPRTKELRAEPFMASLPELRRQLGEKLSDEELLLRATMPAGQVDAMLAAGPAARHYNPALRPVMSLLRQLTAHREALAHLRRETGVQARVTTARPRSERGHAFMSAVVTEAQPLESLPPIKGFMFDLDGTLLLSDRSLGGYEVLPGAIEVLQGLQERAIPFVVLTNGSAYPPAQQAARLRGLGLPIADDRMFTPSSVTADLMSRRGVGRVLVLGNRGVGHALNEAGIETVFTGEPRASEVAAVYVGWHPECGMKDIEAACQAIWAGAKMYVASDVPFFATRQGRSMGYSYAIVGAIRRMTKAPSILTGKPSLHALRFIAKKLGMPARSVGVVGDDPAVEIIMARRGGATAFGVTTGVMTHEDWARETGNRRPHRVLTGIGELLTNGAVPTATSRARIAGSGAGE